MVVTDVSITSAVGIFKIKYHHLTLKLTTAQVVEASVTTNSLSKDYPHPDDHTRQTADTPEFKPFTFFPRLFTWGRGIISVYVRNGEKEDSSALNITTQTRLYRKYVEKTCMSLVHLYERSTVKSCRKKKKVV